LLGVRMTGLSQAGESNADAGFVQVPLPFDD
jgi:hypothetical protein